jgi:chromosome segregation ATPase
MTPEQLALIFGAVGGLSGISALIGVAVNAVIQNRASKSAAKKDDFDVLRQSNETLAKRLEEQNAEYQAQYEQWRADREQWAAERAAWSADREQWRNERETWVRERASLNEQIGQLRADVGRLKRTGPLGG